MASYVLDVGAASRVAAELIGSQHDQRDYDSRTTTGREPGDNGDDPAWRDVDHRTTTAITKAAVCETAALSFV